MIGTAKYMSSTEFKEFVASVPELVRALANGDSGSCVSHALAVIEHSLDGQPELMTYLDAIRDASAGTRLELTQLRLRESQLRRMLAAAEKLISASELDTLLDEIVRAARDMIGCNIAHINLLPGSIGENQRYRIVDGAITNEFKKVYAGASAGLTGQIVTARGPRVVQDYLEDKTIRHTPLSDGSILGESVVTMAGVPIMWGETVVGTLMINYRKRTLVSHETLSLMSSLAALTSVALGSARQFRDIQKTNTELIASNQELAKTTRLLDAANALTSRLSALLVEEAALTDILEEISWGFLADVFLLDERGELLGASVPDFGDIVEFPIDRDDMSPGTLQMLTDETGRKAWFSPVFVHAELVAVLGICRDELTAIEHDTLSRSALIVGTWVVVSRSIATSDARSMSVIVAELIAGGERAQSVYSRAKEHGLDEAKPILAVVAEGEIGRRITIEGLARDFAQRHGVLINVGPSRITLLGNTTDARQLAAEFNNQVIKRSGNVTCTGFDLGEPGILNIRTVYQRARHCMESLQRLGGIGRVANLPDLGFAGMLLGDPSKSLIDEYVRKTIGPMIDYDAKRRSELRQTVVAYFRNGGSLRDTARDLHVHANTVHQRLQRVSVLLGEDWQSPDSVLEVQLALKLDALRGPCTTDDANGASTAVATPYMRKN